MKCGLVASCVKTRSIVPEKGFPQWVALEMPLCQKPVHSTPSGRSSASRASACAAARRLHTEPRATVVCFPRVRTALYERARESLRV